MTVPDINLFKPIQVGSFELQQRLAMAPLTRFRALGHQPLDLHTTYYGQRSSAPGTLIITEATFISEKAGGYPNAPGIFTDEQIDAWRKVYRRVHENESRIFQQLWALGRSATKAELDKKGLPYVSASPIPTATGTPRALTKEEIKEYIQDYVSAAKAAISAGADGIEIHSANGYLLDQFLHENTNQRTDEYGGSIENRARFTLEVVDAVISAIGANKVAVRFSPWSMFGGLDTGVSVIPQFSYVIAELQKRALNGHELAYVHVVEPRVAIKDKDEPTITTGSNNFVRDIWTGVLVRAGGYKYEHALADTNEDDKLVVALGRLFIANPDIVKRWKEGLSLNKYERSTFYTSGEKGYTDYPFASEP